MIQIAQLLEERTMSFSFCLNKTDLLVSCGMALLYQSLGLKQDSKMLKDNERLVNAVSNIVGRTKAASAYDFKRIASLVIAAEEPPQALPTPPGQSPDASMAAPPRHKSPTSKSKKKPSAPMIQAQPYSLGRHPSISETDLLLQQEKLRRMTMPNITPVSGAGRTEKQRSNSRASLDSGRPNPASPMQRRDQRLSMTQTGMIARAAPQQKSSFDHLSMGNGVTQPGPTSPSQNTASHQQHQQSALSPTAAAQNFYNAVQMPPKQASSSGMSASEWEALLGQIDGGQANLYDNIYGGPQQVTLDTPATSAAESSWSPDALDLSTFNLGDFGTQHDPMSEESLSSVSGADDLSSLDFRDFSVGHGGMMPADGFVVDGLPTDGNFGL